jgi:hypothetical protein
VLVSLKDCLTAAQGDANVKAIVVTGANGKFSAGFDITHLAKQQAGGTQQDFGVDVNDFLIKLLEAGPKPTVAGAAVRRSRGRRRDGELTAPSAPRARSHLRRRAGRRPRGVHGVQCARGQQKRAAGPA